MGRRASKGTDPLLSSYHWVKVVRPYWMRSAQPCARCGGEIDRTSGRYYPGTRTVNPYSLVVGHIVGRHEAKLMGWTDAQINVLSNTQPEHARCSDQSGAQYGNRLRRTLTLVTTDKDLDESRKW